MVTEVIVFVLALHIRVPSFREERLHDENKIAPAGLAVGSGAEGAAVVVDGYEAGGGVGHGVFEGGWRPSWREGEVGVWV